MLDFAKTQEMYLPSNSTVGIQIRGNKKIDHLHTRITSQYAAIIEQDTNAISINPNQK